MAAVAGCPYPCGERTFDTKGRLVAPPGLAALLAVEVPVGPAADSRLAAAPDRRDGTGEPDLGRGGIADELPLKLRLAVSPCTVGRYLRKMRPPRGGRPSPRWAAFCPHPAHAVLPCDFSLRSPH